MQRYGVVPRFLVITGCFENAQLEENAYDLIYAASAFHWIPEREGYTKVFALLKPDGVFARFANHPDRFQGNRELTAAIDAIYDAYYYTYYHTKRKAWTAYTAEDARSRAELAEAYGFTDIRYHLYHRERVFSAAEYIELLGTYSDHIAIEGTVRKHFFQEIEAAIDRFGGTITLHDTIDLQMARKPG